MTTLKIVMKIEICFYLVKLLCFNCLSECDIQAESKLVGKTSKGDINIKTNNIKWKKN